MDVLILSSAYEPVKRVGWQRAMKLWLTGRVEVLEEYENRLVRTVSRVFQMPAVVRLVNVLRGRRRHRVTFCKRNVYARDKGRCQYCGKAVPLREATLDHVLPRSRGGRTTWQNVAIACLRCNQRKAARTPDEANMQLLLEPIIPRSLPLPRELTWRTEMPDIWQPYLDWT